MPQVRFRTRTLSRYSALDEDIDALTRRSHVSFALEEGVLQRLASREKDSVNPIKWPSPRRPDFLKPEMQEMHTARRKKGERFADFPPSHEEDFAWSVLLLKRMLRGDPVPQQLAIAISGPNLSGRRETTYKHPALTESTKDPVKVKEEEFDETRRRW